MIWKALKNPNEFLALIERSKSDKVAFGLFKHSTRCGISRMALKQFESAWDSNQDLDLYYLDLLNYREISNLVEKVTGVTHQSPQFIVIVNGEVKYHASHSSIDVDDAVSSLS